MKKLLVVIFVFVAFSVASFAGDAYGITGASKVDRTVTIHTSVALVPLSVIPSANYLDLRTSHATEPGETTIVAAPGSFSQYIIFEVTSAKGYGIAITGGVTAPEQGDTELGLGIYTKRTGDASWYNDVPATAWPIAITGTTGLPTGFNMNATQNATGQVSVLLNVETIKVTEGASVGNRIFTIAVSAEYANI